MRERGKKKGRALTALLLAACLSLFPAAPGYAEAELFSSALTPELEELAVTAGYVHQGFSSTVERYDMTLGPDEAGFSLIASPVEKEGSPTAAVYLDHETEAWCELDFGEPSRTIPVEPGQSRRVLVRSTSRTEGRVREYTIQVHRTETAFVWSPGEIRQAGEVGRILPVTLRAPAGTGLKSLSFALGFDPGKLALADASGAVTGDLYSCVLPAEGFEYRPKGGGYFANLSSEVDNTEGVLRVEYGPGTTSLGKNSAYTVKEDGELLTVWFRILGETGAAGGAELSSADALADHLSILRGADTPRQGISMTDENGLSLECANMVSIEGQSDPDVTDPDPSATGPAVSLNDLLGEGAEVREGRGVLETTEGLVTLTAESGSVESMTEGMEVTLQAEAKSGKLFSYWSVQSVPEGVQTFSMAGDPGKLTANPLRVQVQRDVRYRAVYRNAGEEAATGPALGVMELDQESLEGPRDSDGTNLDRRYLVYTDETGERNFGFRPNVFVYELYLLPGEEAKLMLRSEANVAAVTVSGVSMSDEAARETGLVSSVGSAGGLSWWEETAGQPLTLGLRDGDEQGTVTLTLGNEEGVTTGYTVALHRISSRPLVRISTSGSAVTAAIAETQLREAAFSLALTPEAAQRVTAGGVQQRLEAALEGSGLRVSRIELTGAGLTGAGANELQIVLDTGDASVVSTLGTPLAVPLFEGGMGDILGVGEDAANTIGDTRFGTLFRTTALADEVTLTGTILAYNALKLPEVLLCGTEGPDATSAAAEEPVWAEVALAAGQTGYGLKQFAFTAVLKEGTEYIMELTKDGHTGCTVGGITLSGDSAAKPLRLYAGDFDGDGWVSAFDADWLTLHLRGEESDPLEQVRYDLDGDGAVTLFDADVLTGKENYGGRNQVISWEDVRKGGESE